MPSTDTLTDVPSGRELLLVPTVPVKVTLVAP